MKVLFCIDSLTKGGAERVISNLSNYLVKKEENEINVLTILNTKVQYEFDERVKISSLEDEKIEKLNKVSKFIQRIKKMRQYIKENNPDVILAFLPYTSFIVMLANRKLKKPVIISVRNDPKEEYNCKKYKILKDKFYPKADGFVFQTQEAKEFFQQEIQDKSVVIANPINPEFIEPPFDGEREKNIVSVGRLYEQKNQKLLIDAFTQISDEYKDYNLIIYGEGYLRQELENHVKELNMTERISLPGRVDNVKEKIYKSSLFVLSSDFEGMPNALMEAMALGLPVISTDCPCGGPKFLIDNNKNGMLVEVGNVKELSQAIKKMLDNPEEAKMMGNEANKISERLAPEKINKLWEDYIIEIAKNRRKNGK